MPTLQQISRINDVLYEIHRDITADLSARRLCTVAAFSEQHFHRLFHRVVGESLHQYVRRTRLEQAASQLMFDRDSPVIDIAAKCGFSSLSSFGQAFRATFGVSPGRWRRTEPDTGSAPYLEDPEIAAGYDRVRQRVLPQPTLVDLQPFHVAYVRHRGYGRSIRKAWQTLHGWAVSHNKPFDRQYGLHHSNPAWVPLEQCRYVACLEVDGPILRRGAVSHMKIPGGLHAVFDLQGRYGDLLPYLSRIQQQWLPGSGFKQQTTPALVRYRRNHFLASDEQFDLSVFLPLSLY